MADAGLIQALLRSYVDGSVIGDSPFAPSFVYNSNEAGKKRKVLDSILRNLEGCDEFFWSVAFVKESGLVCVKEVLRELDERGIKGKIITSNYLTFTEPRALESLMGYKNIETRMYWCDGEEDRFGFHTKGYIFRYGENYRILIGSSNLTQAALTVSNEWNNEVVSKKEGANLQSVLSEFNRMWEAASPLKDVYEKYKEIYALKPRLLSSASKEEGAPPEYRLLTPNAMQKSFMVALDHSIEKGDRRGLLISATGTGKTYACAFAIEGLRSFKPKRVLFVTHRETILRQAMDSFRNVFGPKATMGLFTGTSKDYENKDFVFATNSILLTGRNLEVFSRDAFDMVVIDEVHRVGENGYQKIIHYFTPRYLLGMSATPDRMDGYDIYGLFDNNILFEIRLPDALEESLLVPFHYFGITDLEIGGVNVGDFEASNRLSVEKRADHVIEQMRYFGYSGDRLRALAFVDSLESGEAFAKAFEEKGYRARFLSGKDSQSAREEAVRRLSGEEGPEALDILFTVDIFNEGVDIPEVNQVLFLRPTKSPIVFLQQLGRGLRLHEGKEYVVVLDFIGNYQNNYMIPLAFSHKGSGGKGTIIRTTDRPYIEGESTIAFDPIAKERIYRSIDKANIYELKRLKEAYLAAKNRLGKVPSLIEFDENTLADVSGRAFLDLKVSKSFGSYYDFLVRLGDQEDVLSKKEALTLQRLGELIGNGHRLLEPTLLESLMNGESWERILKGLAQLGIPFSDMEQESALAILSFSFLEKEGLPFTGVRLVERRGAGLALTEEAKSSLKNHEFRKRIEEILSYARYSYGRYFSSPIAGPYPFVRYEQYTRKEVSRLLDLVKNMESTLYGYRVFDERKVVPIFVTYQKEVGERASINYEDRFLDNRLFHWLSRNRLTLESEEIKRLCKVLREGGQALLFIKKNDSDSLFYFVGEISGPDSFQAEDSKMRSGESVVSFYFLLKQPVRDDIYHYLTNGEAISEL